MSVRMTSTPETSEGNVPKRGGVHPEYGIYLGGEDLVDNWDLQPYIISGMQCSVGTQRL